MTSVQRVNPWTAELKKNDRELKEKYGKNAHINPSSSDFVSFGGVKYTGNKGDKKLSKTAKLMIGATALAGAIILGVAGYKGHLGKSIQKLLKGALKTVEKGDSNVGKAPTKAQEEVVSTVASPAAEVPKSFTQILEEAGIKNEKLVKALEEDGTGLKIEHFSRYKDWEASVKELRESGKYGDRIKKIAFIFPEKTKEVLIKEGVDVSNLPKNTYIRQFLDKNEKGVYTELVLADELEMDLKIKMVRPYAFGTGCNIFEI